MHLSLTDLVGSPDESSLAMSLAASRSIYGGRRRFAIMSFSMYVFYLIIAEVLTNFSLLNSFDWFCKSIRCIICIKDAKSILIITLTVILVN